MKCVVCCLQADLPRLGVLSHLSTQQGPQKCSPGERVHTHLNSHSNYQSNWYWKTFSTLTTLTVVNQNGMQCVMAQQLWVSWQRGVQTHPCVKEPSFPFWQCPLRRFLSRVSWRHSTCTSTFYTALSVTSNIDDSDLTSDCHRCPFVITETTQREGQWVK